LGRFRTQLPSATDGDLIPDAAAARLHVQADQLEDAAQVEILRRPLSPSEDCRVPGAVGVLLVLALAGLVPIVAAGLVPAAVAVLMGFAIPLVGSVWRLGALLAGGLVAIGSIPGISRPGCWGVATRRAYGQHRSTCPSRRRHRRAGLGFLYHQAEGSPDEGPEQRAHDNQELATTAKRLVHRASKVEHPHYVAEAPPAQT
jgi:hypothetical protein